MARLRTPLLVPALLLAACARERAPAGLGRRLVEGPARALAPSPDGAYLAFLDRCARPPVPNLPADAASCDLEVVPAGGGPVRRVAEGVSSLPGGFAWRADGRALAALGDYDHAAGRGRLVLWPAGGEPVRLADAVAFWGFGPRGELGLVAGGVLRWVPPGGADAEPLPAASRIATFEFAPAGAGGGGTWMLARRETPAGGQLLALGPGGAVARDAGAPVGDYAFSPAGDAFAFTTRGAEGSDLHLGEAAGAGRTRAVGRGVGPFAFSRDGSAIAYLAGLAPGRSGDLYVAPVRGRGDAVRLAAAAGEFRWARAAPRLAWLQDFDARVRSGTLAVGGPGARPVVLARNVTSWDLTPDGTRIAFLEHVTAGGYSVDLRLAAADGAGPPETVARGVFGFDFSPEGDRLYYRTACVRDAEACDLYAVPAAGPGPDRGPERIAEGVKSFEFDRRNPGRLLVTWARRDLVALDLAVLERGRLVAVDRGALPGSAAFLGPDSRRLAYVVAEPARAGVYVADLPR